MSVPPSDKPRMPAKEKMKGEAAWRNWLWQHPGAAIGDE
jgi:hypothetical protein